ncbi:hypothetical protein EJB05_16250, partial [Eragrostis curvula]
MMRSSGGSRLASPSPTMCSAQHPPSAALQEDHGEGIQRREQEGAREAPGWHQHCPQCVLPNIHPVLLSKKTVEKASSGGSKEVESPKKA